MGTIKWEVIFESEGWRFWRTAAYSGVFRPHLRPTATVTQCKKEARKTSFFVKTLNLCPWPAPSWRYFALWGTGRDAMAWHLRRITFAAAAAAKKRPRSTGGTHRIKATPTGTSSDNRLKPTHKLPESPLSTCFGPLQAPRGRWP
jgi:hypothetical protein